MSSDNTKEWTSPELLEKLVSGEKVYLLDVRSREQFNRARIDPGRVATIENVPLPELPAFAASGVLPHDTPIVAVCNRGQSSARAVEALRHANISAINFAGGMLAWSKHYEVRPVVEGSELSIIQLSRPARGCLSYIVSSNGQALIIDPLRHTDRYVEVINEKGLTVVAVIDTHGHADHISSGPELAEVFGAKYYLHPDDAVHPFDNVRGTTPFEPLHDGQKITCGSLDCTVLHVPGHTLGNCALLINDGYLIASDTIFLDAISRPDLGGQSADWSKLHFRSLNRLAALPDSLIVLPGHFSALGQADPNGLFLGKLGQLRNTNPGLKGLAAGESEFVAQIQAAAMTIPPQYIEIKRINLGLREVPEEIADELESGKNQCAVR